MTPLGLNVQDRPAWPLPELSRPTQHTDKPQSPAGTGHQAWCPVAQVHAHSVCAHTAHTGTADASRRPQGAPQFWHVSTAARPRKIKANPGAPRFLQEHHLRLFHPPKSKGILLRPLKTLLRPAYNHTWSPKNVSVSDITFSAKQQNPHHWDSWEEKRHPWTVREGQVTPGFPAIHPGGRGGRPAPPGALGTGVPRMKLYLSPTQVASPITSDPTRCSRVQQFHSPG